jgi:tyrosinase
MPTAESGKSETPEMVGATEAPFTLVKEIRNVSLAIHQPTGPARLSMGQARLRVYLRVENLRSDTMAPSYTVYLNVPPDQEPERHPELRAGVLSMFGLLESSRENRKHPGNGLTYNLNITEVWTRLVAMKAWDPNSLRVTFLPDAWDDPVNVQVGRVSLYYG